MLCAHCQTPNPDGALTCMECHESLYESDATLDSGSARLTSTPAILPSGKPSPAIASQRAPGSSLAARTGQPTLPEGFEIGHRYRVVKLLGRGGMGAVYKVRDLELDRDVALKLIRPEIAEDPAVLERFKREIQLSSRVTHRNVLRVYDLGENDGIRYLTMQYVEGENLESVLKREGRLPLPRLLALFRQICEGLAVAHEQGVIHRDLKPQNVMLDAAGTAYLTDFGLAKTLAGSAMTEMGAILGTPFYMSPEQVRGEQADTRSDIFALGVILYEMATGQVPFTGDSAYEVMMRRLSHKPKPAAVLNPEIPAFLQKITERCMATDRAARYQTVAEVLADLESGTFHSSVRYATRKWRRLLPLGWIAALAVLAALGSWLYQRGRSHPPVTLRPQSVLIADFENRTGEAVFEGTLESAFGIALEGASFITSYNRASARKIAAQLQPGAAGLPDAVARLVAVREGVQVVAGGSIERQGDGYAVEVHAVDAVTGKPIEKTRVGASGKEDILPVVAKAAAAVRAALGDATPASLQLAAAETFSAGSLDAAHEYARAQEEQYAGKYEDAIRDYSKAIELDSNLGRAYAGLAVVFANQGQREKAEEEYKRAMARIDRMSDREKYRTRGGYYLLVREPQKALEQFNELVRLYPADAAGIANLALAHFYRRDMARALAEGRRATEIYPKNVPQHNNVALYALYAGDFETAAREARVVLGMNQGFVLAHVALALAQLGQGHPETAADTFRTLAPISPRGASLSAMGLADLALAEGRAADAIPILEKGIEADLGNRSTEAAAAKLTALADAERRAGRVAAALAAADRAVATSRVAGVLFSAARIYLETGKGAKALSLADELGRRLEPDPQAYAALIRGEAQLARGNAREAIRSFDESKKIADTWLVRFDLGRAYLETRAFPEADAELEQCVRRRGEAMAVFLDDVPSFRYLPPVYYYLGRAQEGLKSPAAADSYKAFLAIKGTGGGDPLVADARGRLGTR